MLRLSTPGYRRLIQSSALNASFGGGEANVAVSLARAGIPVDYVTRLPADNDIAEWCMAELRKYGVGTEQIARGGHRVGIYFLETGAMARASKVVYDRAHSAMAEIAPGMIDWDATLADAQWFHWTGITPALSQSAADACLEAVQEASRRGLVVSVDLNYRKNLWRYGKAASDVMPHLTEYCDVLLGNEEDAYKVFGIAPDGFDVSHTGGTVPAEAFEPVCLQLKARFPRLQTIALTLRGSINANHNTWGGLLHADRLYASKRYDMTHIVDRVGGGDAFMAGLIYGLITFASERQRVVDFAAAASYLKHSIDGDFNLVSLAEVNNLLEGDGSGRVAR